MNLNLCNDPWLPFRLASGETVELSLRELGRDDIRDIVMPRQDFYGAAWQFLIGILQTVFAPSNEDEWLARYENPPSLEELAKALGRVEHAFELFDEGPCFMQDFDVLEDGTAVDVSSLLIDAPGGNTLKLNTDHFIKRGQVSRLSPAMAAIALFTLQINAPSGGQGHRTGLRGGGPLTTLVVSSDPDLSLIRRLWLNVLPTDSYPELKMPERFDESVFPWLAPTRISKEKGSEVYMSDDGVHALQQYWAMPRRIRLEEGDGGQCDLTGQTASATVSAYRTRNYGINYDGTWAHPLTPYRFDPRKPEQPHFSSKGQPGGIGYRQWHQFLFKDQNEGYLPARVITQLESSVREIFEDELDVEDQLSVWVFGFDMDNMKARSWHETRMPFLAMSSDLVPLFVQEVGGHVELASEFRKSLRRCCKHAWVGDGDSSGDLSFIDDQFWSDTEGDFYETVYQLKADIEAGAYALSSEACQQWITDLKNRALSLFDALVLSDASATENIERKLEARRRLEYIPLKKAYLDKHELNKRGEVSA